ncbi:unnamed protein product [Caenorhabditis auriculariae]|uniref:Uncharacterized protein n=1 Tax=Caenorhabditis auriculariae TaxID=2777116 RepID=A0A8S1HCX3_9PELO|nr:unnamed protein product [Caenorhabditis auriculariae]
MPEGQPEWYWSLLEFGLKITRHSPYFTYTTVYPLMTVALVNLLAFWTESHRTASTLLMMSLAVQSIIGWVLLRKMPPGSGGTPKLIKLYCLNLILSALSYTVIVVSAFLERLLPEDIDFGLHITELPDLLGLKPFFNAPAISFDPQELGEKDNDAPLGESEYNSPITTIGMSTAFDNPSAVGPNGALEGSPTPAPSSSQAEDDDGTTLIPLSSLAADVEQHRNKKNKTLNRSDDVEANEFDENATKLQIQLTTFLFDLRRSNLASGYFFVEIYRLIYISSGSASMTSEAQKNLKGLSHQSIGNDVRSSKNQVEKSLAF